MKEMKFLGHVVTPNGIMPDKEKTEVIDKINQPNYY